VLKGHARQQLKTHQERIEQISCEVQATRVHAPDRRGGKPADAVRLKYIAAFCIFPIDPRLFAIPFTARFRTATLSTNFFK
jgi:hypothetical protein